MRVRNALWPWVKDEDLWLRSKETGFTTIPRAMPLLGRALDQLSGKGFPLAQTYLSLWCLVFDEAFVEVKDTRTTSYEAGFTGKRGETTWKQRMRRLQELEFIDIKPGVSHDMQYVLLLDPFQAIAKRFSSQTNDVLYQAIVKKQFDVGGRPPSLSPSQVQRTKEDSSRQLVVVIDHINGVPKPIDVVSNENFLLLTEDGSSHAEVQSLAVRGDGSRYIHATKFKIEDNKTAFLKFKEWSKENRSNS
jgi:hypothetical protein